jgi:2,3-dihydroxyphenylpropionate 1,2-dioxygenase
MLAVCASHSPLMLTDIEPTDARRQDDFRQALTKARTAIEAFDPELVVVFAPDHFKGLFFDLMPSFCIGLAAQSTEDWGATTEHLQVASASALDCVRSLHVAGFDVAVSHRLRVDHGTTIPLRLLAGGPARYPVLPIVINCVADPRPSFARTRQFGRAVGEFLALLNKRVLIIGSGGLSHDPPTPRLADAPAHIAERLIARHTPTTADLAAREARVMAAARAMVAGGGPCRPPSERFDRDFLAAISEQDLARFDRYTDELVDRDAGFGGHEVRCWVATLAAMQAQGDLDIDLHYYAIVPEWITGMAVLEMRTRAMQDADDEEEVLPETLSAANDI